MDEPTHKAGVAAYQRGVELYRKGEFADALPCFYDTVEASPEFYRGFAFLALCLGKLGKVDEAITANERCLEIEPGYHKAINNLGECWRRKLDMTRAAEFFAEAVRLRPAALDYQGNLALTYLDIRRPDKAIDPLRAAWELDRGNYDWASRLAECLYQMGDVAAATEVMETFMKDNRDHIQWPEMEARLKLLKRRQETPERNLAEDDA